MDTILTPVHDPLTPTQKTALAQAVMTAREQAAEARATRWFRIVLGLCGLLGLAVVMIGYQSSIPRLIPIVVEQDAQQRTLYVGPPKSFTPTDIHQAGQLLDWIWNSRRRGDDLAMMGEMRQKAERMTLGKALQSLQAYHAGTTPGEANEATKALKQNPIRTQLSDFRVYKRGHEWDIEWRETWTPTYGVLPKVLKVRGWFVMEQRLTPAPFGLAQMRTWDATRAPLGLYVIEYGLTETWEEG